MAELKLISPLSTIERALGILEGISVGLTGTAAEGTLIDAVEMIENALKEILDDMPEVR